MSSTPRAHLSSPDRSPCHGGAAEAGDHRPGALAVDFLGREVNAVTDNLLIFADSGDILYGGNFHAEPVGMAALALAETGSMAERRIALRWAWPYPVSRLIWH
jgi:hypothetical protein